MTADSNLVMILVVVGYLFLGLVTARTNLKGECMARKRSTTANGATLGFEQTL